MITKQLYQVTVSIAPNLEVNHTLKANSPAHACRKAFRYFIKSKQLLRQPPSTDDGGFRNTTVTIL